MTAFTERERKALEEMRKNAEISLKQIQAEQAKNDEQRDALNVRFQFWNDFIARVNGALFEASWSKNEE